MTIVLEQLFRGFFCPAFVCAVVLALACRPWRRRVATEGTASLGAALATASGYSVGHGLIVGWSYFAPLEKKDWLPCLCVMITALVVAERARALRHVRVRWSLRVIVSAVAIWLVVGPSDGPVFAGMTVAISGLWIAVESLARRRAGAGPALTSLVALVAASAVMVLSGSASFGQLTGALAACVATLTLMAWRRANLVFLHGASGMIVVLPAVLWFNLHRSSYTEVPVTSALLVGAAMLSGWVAELDAIRRRGPWARASVYVLAALIPAALAVIVAWSVSEPPGDYDY